MNRTFPAARRRLFQGGLLAVMALLPGSCPRGIASSPTIVDVVTVPRLSVQSDLGVTNQIQVTSALGASPWMPLTSLMVTQSPYVTIDANDLSPGSRVYRVAATSGNRPTITHAGLASKLIVESALGITNQIQYTSDPALFPWTTLTNTVVTQSPYAFLHDVSPADPRDAYRVLGLYPGPPPPTNMVYVPGGPFQMGDPLDGLSDALPVHAVSVGPFLMDPTEVTRAMWDEVYYWAITNGYSFSGSVQSVGANHPVHSVTWHDAVKWCNARSEKEGRVPAYYTNVVATVVYRTGQFDAQNTWVLWTAGYRLPTEAEWEKAARGGTAGHRFPWADADTISHGRANYLSFWQNGQPAHAYDTSQTNGYHPAYVTGSFPYTSPAGQFAANGYGLYDLAGNVWEWCWDRWSASYYASSPETDPLGPTSGQDRVLRGGSWATHASGCRVAFRGNSPPDTALHTVGFRAVLPQADP